MPDCTRRRSRWMHKADVGKCASIHIYEKKKREKKVLGDLKQEKQIQTCFQCSKSISLFSAWVHEHAERYACAEHLLSISYCLSTSLPYLAEHVRKAELQSLGGLLVHTTIWGCLRGVVRVAGRKLYCLRNLLWGYWVSFNQTQEPPRPLHLVLLSQSPDSPEQHNHFFSSFPSVD